MYIIKNGKAYQVDGEVAYLINFTTTGDMKVDKDQTIEVVGNTMYTYDEIYAKLNVAYMIEEAKRKNAIKAIAKELENKEKVEKEPVVEEKKEDKSTKKNNK